MENVTIGQIISVVTTLTVIGGFVATILKWWKSRITNKFDEIEDKFTNIEKRLDYVEEKREEYEKEVENSKFERMILLRGELAALKGLYKMGCDDTVTHSINEIEEYMMRKSHD